MSSFFFRKKRKERKLVCRDTDLEICLLYRVPSLRTLGEKRNGRVCRDTDLVEFGRKLVLIIF